jgi:putative ABC transport system substrate-binding protein
VIERSGASGKSDQLGDLARALVAGKPALIVAATSGSVSASMAATTTIPIVFAAVGEPVQQGFVASLARPGGNVTGTTFRHEVFGKLVELVRATLPAVRRIAAFELEGDPVSKRVSGRFQDAATALGVKLDIVRTQVGEDLARAFAELRSLKSEALVLSPQYPNQAKRIGELASSARLPTFGSFSVYAEQGVLMSYANDPILPWTRAAVLVDKILRGAKPADLPVEEPERFVMVVNQRTARAIGITVPQDVLLRADRVIE